MERFSKTFTILFNEDQDCAASRMVRRLEEAENEGRGVQIMLMRHWMQAGFLLEEIGRGLDTSLIDMDQDGLFHKMSKVKQAEILIKMIEQKIWQHNLMESVKSPPEPVVSATKPEITISDTLETKEPPVALLSDTPKETTPPKKKKRRRPANIII